MKRAVAVFHSTETGCGNQTRFSYPVPTETDSGCPAWVMEQSVHGGSQQQWHLECFTVIGGGWGTASGGAQRRKMISA